MNNLLVVKNKVHPTGGTGSESGSTQVSPRLSFGQANALMTSVNRAKNKISKQATVRLEKFPDDKDVTYLSAKDMTCRQKGMLVMDHMYFTLSLTVIVLLSLGLFFATLFNVVLGPSLQMLEYVIVFIFVIETFFRCVFMGPKAYFTNFLCMCDLFVSVLDLVLFIIDILEVPANEYLTLIRILRVSRLSKVSRIARVMIQVDTSVGNDDRGKDVMKDEDGHIYSFNSATLFSLGYMYNFSGTVLVMPEIWVQALIMVILTTLLAALTCPLKCDPMLNTFDSDFTDCSSCVNSIDPNYGLMFLGIAAFLLGIFAQLLFDSWWNIRQLLQQLFSEIKDTAMLTTSFIRGSDDESIELRRDVVRWSKLGAFLLEKEIDGKANFRWAVEQGWLKESEWDFIEGKEHAFVIVQQWAFDRLCLASEQGLAAEYGGTFDNLLNTFTTQRNICADILMILYTPMPYIFVHLMTVICKVNLIFTSLACGTVVGQAVKQQQPLQIVIGYIIVILGNMLIEGLLRLHVVLSDPFGDDACDFPWQMLLDEMDTEVQQMTEQFGKLKYEVRKTPGNTPSATPRTPRTPRAAELADKKKEKAKGK